MDLSSPAGAAVIGLACLACAVTGAWTGIRLARRRRRGLERRLARVELALLEARTDASRVERAVALEGRRAAALRLALRRLGVAEARTRDATAALEAGERRHFLELAGLRVRAAQSRRTARRAAALARRATGELKRLEATASAVQTIMAHEPKSYGAGEVHAVRVVDRSTVDARRDAVARVSHRDSARLARLAPSNEAVGVDLRATDGISPAIERRPREAGTRGVEPLSERSDAEADGLDRTLRGRRGAPPGARWRHGAREVPEGR